MSLNGQKITAYKKEINKENKNLYVVDYMVPEIVNTKKQKSLKFIAKEKRSTPKVFYVRLLK